MNVATTAGRTVAARTLAGVVFVVFGVVAAMIWTAGTAGAAVPSVTITPSPTNGSYASGQSVSVSVGANSLLTPGSRVSIIECADPGGAAANLPTSISACDEDTIQGDTVLVQRNGSLTEQHYTLYALPNAALGEQASWLPVCSATHQCVLYVGENQNDFSQPKVFSQPFAFTMSASDAPVISSKSGPTSATVPKVSASVSLPAATLAFTGLPGRAVWLALVGLSLAVAGTVGRRALRRSGR